MHSELIKLRKGGLYRGTYSYCFDMGVPPSGINPLANLTIGKYAVAILLRIICISRMIY